MPSASGFPLLFGHLVGTSRPSDFPSTCMLDFWITSFSNRPVHNCVSGVDGTSRFSRVKFPRMPGVFDCAEPVGCSHFAFAGVAFRILEQRRHSDFRPLSRLNTLPACSPVNASRAALRLPAHDSGPGWLATPYLYNSCIRDFTPVYPGALQLGSKTWPFGAVFGGLIAIRATESMGLRV
jgi:hypothetical protein